MNHVENSGGLSYNALESTIYTGLSYHENEPHLFNSSEPKFETFGDCTASSPQYWASDVQHAFAQHPPACTFTALCKSRNQLCVAILKSHILYTPPPTTTTTIDHRCCSNGNQAGPHHVSFWLTTWEKDVLDSPSHWQCLSCISRQSVILQMEDSRVIGVF